jgi:hypothetical protein
LRTRVLLVVLLVAPLMAGSGPWLGASLEAQSLDVSTTGGMLRVRSGFGFIEGAVMDRLRDGRTLRLDFELTVFDGPRGGGEAVAAARQSFNLSFDLWEERIAVTRAGKPPRSVSHLRPRDAEVWCLESLAIARTELSRLTRDTPFWIRLAFQVPDQAAVQDSDGDETLTIRRLIDVLSRRPRQGELGRSIDAGPFRLSN